MLIEISIHDNRMIARRTVDPSSGNYVLVAAQENALVAFTPAGAAVCSRPLPLHR
jgi:hypothetical protein